MIGEDALGKQMWQVYFPAGTLSFLFFYVHFEMCFPPSIKHNTRTAQKTRSIHHKDSFRTKWKGILYQFSYMTVAAHSEVDTFVAVMLWRLSHCNNLTAGARRMVAMEMSASANLLLHAEGHETHAQLSLTWCWNDFIWRVGLLKQSHWSREACFRHKMIHNCNFVSHNSIYIPQLCIFLATLKVISDIQLT